MNPYEPADAEDDVEQQHNDAQSTTNTSSSSTSTSTQGGSSSSSSSSSQQETTATTSSSGSASSLPSSEPDIISSRHVVIINHHQQQGKKETNMRTPTIDDQLSSGSAIEEEDATTRAGAPQQVKRYKNSPFGLTRHYLTMPDSGQPPGVVAGSRVFNQEGFNASSSSSRHNKQLDDDETDEDSEPTRLSSEASRGGGDGGGGGGGNKLKTQRGTSNADRPAGFAAWKRGNHKSPSSELDQFYHDENRAITSHAASDSSAASLSTPWPGYGDASGAPHHDANRLSHPVLTGQPLGGKRIDDPIDLVAFGHHQNHHHRHQQHHLYARPPSALSPAGDAGLDAKKCNAKDIETADCFGFGATNHEDDDDDDYLHGHQKLKLAAAAGLSRAPESSGLLVRFSSIMYATFLVILGCILHVSELRQKSKNSSDHIYTTIVALLGIGWLLFLQADLQRYKRYASKYILIESIFNDQRQRRREEEQLAQSGAGGGGLDPSARSTSSSSASLVNDRMSMNTEVIFKKTAYKMYQRRVALDRYGQKMAPHGGRHRERAAPSSKFARSVGHHQTVDHSVYKPSGAGSLFSSKAPSALGADGGDHDGHHENLVPAYKFLQGKRGANFYLKCGMAAFCFGHVIHEGLRFGQQVYFFGTGNVQCRDSAALVAHLVTPLYSFYQLFMMFKYSNLVINRHRVLARFGLMHIIGTSITFWFRTIMEEAFEDFVHKMDYFKTNKPQMELTMAAPPASPSANSNHLASLLASITSAIKTEASERSDWSVSTSQHADQQHNMTRAQSLLSLMSSPFSATITPQIARHLPDSYACAQNTLLTTKSMNALPYLYPFTIEYNLLLAATFLSLYFNIGKIGVPGSGATCRPALTASSSPSYSNTTTKNPGSLCSSPGSHVESSDNSSATRTRIGVEKEEAEYKSNFVVNADCHSANKGLFCGFFVLLVTLVTIVIFFVTINKPTHVQLGIKINLIQEATLTALILIVTLAGFKQVVKLNRNPYLKDKVTTDDVLMLVPLPFFFIHSLLSFRAETASMSSGSISSFSSILLQRNHPQNSVTTSSGNLQPVLLSATNNNTQIESRSRLNNLLAGHPNATNDDRFVEDFISFTNNSNSSSNRNGRNISSIDSGSNSQIDHFKLITVALNIIVMIEVLVQTNFIIDGMRRCSESRYLRFKKPGRELITFAILLNITYWIVATFETKSVEQYKTEIEYYGPLPYMFISHTTLPVMLFYRYHSSVCLAEIWNRAYKPPKKR